MTAMSEHKDAAGNDLSVGDFICYANVHGRSANLKFGRIVNLPDKKIQCVAIARTWKSDWRIDGGDVAFYSLELPRKVRVNTLAFLDRTLKIERHMIPEEGLKLLDFAYSLKNTDN